MEHQKKPITSPSRLLRVLVVLLALILLGQWLGGGGGGANQFAQAQIANPAADRQELIDQIKQTNEKLDTLIELLRSGNLQVKVAPPAQPDAKAKGR